MRLGAKLRDEFPRGWLFSGRWWLEGLRDIGVRCVAAVATVLFFREAMNVVRWRDEPRRLSRLRGTDEGYVAGLLVNFVGLVGAGLLFLRGSTDLSIVALGVSVALTAWCLLNVVTSAVVVWTLVSSRIRHRQEWVELDFVDQHRPRYGRPPETIEEYRAQRLGEGEL